MDMLQKLKECMNIKEFVNTSNYYYERHSCTVSHTQVKVQLDYTLSSDTDNDILRFGICPHCGICFYHKDVHNKNW